MNRDKLRTLGLLGLVVMLAVMVGAQASSASVVVTLDLTDNFQASIPDDSLEAVQVDWHTLGGAWHGWEGMTYISASAGWQYTIPANAWTVDQVKFRYIGDNYSPDNPNTNPIGPINTNFSSSVVVQWILFHN